MKRIAICLSGQFRGIYYTLQPIKLFWEKYFKDYDNIVIIDYFIYGSNRITSGGLIHKFYNKIVNYKIDDEYFNYISAILNPKKIEIDIDEQNIKNHIKNIYKNNYEYCEYFINSECLYQYFYSQESIKLKEKYESDNDIKYDIVIRHRLDLLFDFNIDYNRQIWNNINFNNCIFSVYVNDTKTFVNDMLTISNNDISNNIYDNLFDTITNFMIVSNEKIDFDKPTEYWYAKALCKKTIPCSDININLCICRDQLINNIPNFIQNLDLFSKFRLLDSTYYIFNDILYYFSKKYNIDIYILINLLKSFNFDMFIYISFDLDQMKNYVSNIIETILNKKISS